jgi:ribosome-associated translation inhibitor RaiA
MMQIQINTGHNISGREEMIRQTEAVVKNSLGHLADHITRVEVHISDENNKKGGGYDKRCLMEARLEGHQPIAVTHEAKTVVQAISGAADKLKNSLDHTLGRLSDHEGRKHVHINTSNSIIEGSDEFI